MSIDITLDTYQEYLFAKRVLVYDSTLDRSDRVTVLSTLVALRNLFGIRVPAGSEELVQPRMIKLASKVLGQEVPEPFYRGFPQSVRTLSREALLFDQLVHYAVTYGFGNFSQPGHSILEQFERVSFNESVEDKLFDVLTEEEALQRLIQSMESLLSGTRPLSDYDYKFLKTFLTDSGYRIEHCASKDTAIRLLLDLRDVYYARFLCLSDVLKYVDKLNESVYNNRNLKKLNLRNQDRKFIAQLIDYFFASSAERQRNIKECYERKALWRGLLHHIHYVGKNPSAIDFVSRMRNKGNESVYSEFEKLMGTGEVVLAAEALLCGKGSGAVLRNLDYILSRCRDEEQIMSVLSKLSWSNPLILLQLLTHYTYYDNDLSEGRVFSFTRYNRRRIHNETNLERAKRRSALNKQTVAILCATLREKLCDFYRGKLGSVFVSPQMKKLAVPLQENTSSGGFGVMPTGSRLSIPAGQKVRAFTYWEKVNDIDLSMFGLTEDGQRMEFSWRTMASRQSDAVTFSGDETSGYYGGSEYFDVDLDAVRKLYPGLRFMVLCNNVFTGGGITFSKCFCTAGFMLRDLLDSGEVFEPKTVKTSFLVNCNSRFAYLFAIDLETRECVWLNIAQESNAAVAGMTSFNYVLRTLKEPPVVSIYDLLEMTATKLVDDPAKAELVVSDDQADLAVATGAVLHSWDLDKCLALVNGNAATVMQK
ncbi:MAG: hypothetical protein Q4G03_09480 [Planctomycetia bacterium]|nr:hypothetical protein [Planctomycetia bacterium]